MPSLVEIGQEVNCIDVKQHFVCIFCSSLRLVPNYSWLKLAQWFWRKMILNFVNVFLLFLIIIFRWKRAGAFIWTKLKPLHLSMLCAKFGWNGPVVLEKKMKMWTVYRQTDGQTELSLSWAKKPFWDHQWIRSPGERWATNTQAKKFECVVCLRKSYSSQGLCVMRLDMGTINSFCLDDGVRKLLLMWDCHYWFEISRLCLSASNPMKTISSVLVG